jgi:DNA-binding PadR family transcriptional regulator
MKPLNYAILKYMTTAGEVSVAEVMDALRAEYGRFRAFNKTEMLRALMTAEVNGLLEETRYDLDGKGEARVFFKAHPEGAATINRYIRD